MSLHRILTLFGHEGFSVVSDSEEFFRECTYLGFDIANISAIEKLPSNSLVFSFSNEAAKLTFDVARNTENKKAFSVRCKYSSLPWRVLSIV